jgi:mitochondrial import inner membrane translocase subunit TIM21
LSLLLPFALFRFDSRIILTAPSNGQTNSKMSPNRIFDKSFDVIRADNAIQQKYGAGIKAYGRDHGGHREGRRNFIEHKEYVDEMTGDKRVRVRYNIEGPYGKAFVFAEVSASMSANEFVYILVQDKADGRTQTIVDNRAALAAQHMAGGNEQASSVISQLLRGGGGGSSPKN